MPHLSSYHHRQANFNYIIKVPIRVFVLKIIFTGLIQNLAIDEASGLAHSRRNPGILYTQNDSGDAPRVFAIDEQGYSKGGISFKGIMAA